MRPEHKKTLMRVAITVAVSLLAIQTFWTYYPRFLSKEALTHYVLEHRIDSSVSRGLPIWIHKLCPEVAEHFMRFPYFSNFTEIFSVMTSEYGAHSVCTLVLASHLAEEAEAPMYLHAGSHLGAIIHGGPIPWDDDVDVFLPYSKLSAFLHKCRRLRESRKELGLECFVGHNALKIAIVTERSVKTRRGWMAPFVDVFLFKMDGSNIYEVNPYGDRTARSPFALRDYFPVQPFYFGGATFLGPQDKISLRRYDTKKCVVSCFHHRHERSPVCKGQYEIDCATLAEHFPFVDASRNSLTDRYGQHWSIGDKNVASQETAISLWNVSITKRNSWGLLPESYGQRLSDTFPNIDAVEVDNSVSPQTTCGGSGSTLVVVEFNAGRGTNWQSISHMLAQLRADVLILNEMDLGMARSGQQHTARLLAHSLKMNYAWGIEFVELTRGTSSEQDDTKGSYNFLGLHGNAILSKCHLRDVAIVRDPIGPYYDRRANDVNAHGTERRLGGRMALLARVSYGTPQEALVLGSVHKLATHLEDAKAYVGSSAAIIAGDQDWDFCSAIGLVHVDERDHHTYPASCSSTGNHRGDIICSNLDVVSKEKTFLPCPTCTFGTRRRVSDHAPTFVTLGPMRRSR